MRSAWGECSNSCGSGVHARLLVPVSSETPQFACFWPDQLQRVFCCASGTEPNFHTFGRGREPMCANWFPLLLQIPRSVLYIIKITTGSLPRYSRLCGKYQASQENTGDVELHGISQHFRACSL